MMARAGASTGDAITAFFPDPGGEAAAAAAGHAIQAHLAAHPAVESPVGSFTIQAKVGIASGEHALMVVGRAGRSDYVFAGSGAFGCRYA